MYLGFLADTYTEVEDGVGGWTDEVRAGVVLQLDSVMSDICKFLQKRMEGSKETPNLRELAYVR
jgi:hypothetical protein